MERSTKELALCSMLAALGVVLLYMSGVIPLSVYACPILASAVLIPAKETCRRSFSWCCFGAIAILGLILGPDKEAALLFCALGYYPLIKPRLDTIRPLAAQWMCKLVLAAVAVAAVYLLLMFVLCLPGVVEEITETAGWMLWTMAALGLLVFVLYDLMLGRFTALYRRRKR